MHLAPWPSVCVASYSQVRGLRCTTLRDKVRHIPLACLWEEAWVPQVGSRGGANRLLEVEVNLHTA